MAEETKDDDIHLNFVKDGVFYIHGDIDDTIPYKITAELNKQIEENMKIRKPDPIKFFVSSYGGYIQHCFDIISLFDYAKKNDVPIHTYVTSTAFSASSLIAVAGHKRFASRRAYHGLHFMRGSDYSHNPTMAERNLKNTKWLQNELVHIYKTHTKLKDIEKKLLADNYMINGFAELKKYGLADEEF